MGPTLAYSTPVDTGLIFVEVSGGFRLMPEHDGHRLDNPEFRRLVETLTPAVAVRGRLPNNRSCWILLKEGKA